MNAQAVATRVDQLPLAPASSESAAILSVIERMATNPDIDPERVERFIALKRQMDADAARKAFYNALSDAKAEIPVINKNRVVGYWDTVKMSAAMPTLRRRQLLERIEALSNAVKAAREQANEAEAPPREVAKALFDYLFAEPS